MRAEGGVSGEMSARSLGTIGSALLIGFAVSRPLPHAVKLTLTSSVLVLPYSGVLLAYMYLVISSNYGRPQA